MLNIDVSQRTFGINHRNHVTTVKLFAPQKQQVGIKADNATDIIALEKDAAGYWTGTAASLLPGTLYKLNMDGEDYPDPYSLFQPDGVHGSSQVVDLTSYQWRDALWSNLPQEDYIFYEIHTGTFTADGTFSGIATRLDYLLELGITAIEIMPIAQFPGDRNWGYDGVFPFAVQNSYGAWEGLQQLVDACHQKGIAVVLDVVCNHLGPEGNYLGTSAPFFTGKYHTPWGDAINFDDEWSDGIRSYFIENALMWLRDFHIDALRLDAVHAIKDMSATHLLRELRFHVDRLIAETGRQYYLFVESDLNDNKFINTIDQQGYGMDGQWVDEFHHALRIASGEPPVGYLSDFDGVAHLAKSYTDAYVYDGMYSQHRKRTFGIKAANNPGKQFIVFSQNHDQVGNRMLGERTSKLVSGEMLKLMAASVMISPFLPLLFMGEEYCETRPFLYFISHSDNDLLEAVRKGRKAEFAAFHLQGEAPDPGDPATFEQSKLDWEQLNLDKHHAMFLYTKTLIALRKTEAALHTLNRTNINATADAKKRTIMLHRWTDTEHLFCLLNFSHSPQWLELPAMPSLQRIFDSAGDNWQKEPDLLKPVGPIAISPESISIFKTTHDSSNIDVPTPVS